MPKPDEKPIIEIIARGLWLHRGRILLCQNRRHGHVFLPGGHVDFGEPAAVALRRELREELGAEARVGALLAIVEACFQQGSDRPRKAGAAPDPGLKQGGRPHHEINLIFQIHTTTTRSKRGASSHARSLGRPPAPLPGSDEVPAQEEHLRFFWCPVNAVLGREPEVLVLPRIMPKALSRLLTAASGAWRVTGTPRHLLWRDWP